MCIRSLCQFQQVLTGEYHCMKSPIPVAELDNLNYVEYTVPTNNSNIMKEFESQPLYTFVISLSIVAWHKTMVKLPT